MGKKRQFKRPKDEKQGRKKDEFQLPGSELSVPVRFKTKKANDSDQSGTEENKTELRSRESAKLTGDKTDLDGTDVAGSAPASGVISRCEPPIIAGQESSDEIEKQAAANSEEPHSEDNQPDDGGSCDTTSRIPDRSKDGSRKRRSVSDIVEEQLSDAARETARRRLLASTWRVRDRLYQQLFGKPAYVTPKNYGPPSEDVPPDFKERGDKFSQDTSDPGDPALEEQHLAVLAYAPDPLSPYWRYVTAGLCSPWLQYEPQLVSGFGLELMVKSPTDAPWAARFLRTLAFYVFNHAGTLSPGGRVGLNGPIDPASNSQLRNAFIWYADEAPDALYDLPSGGFGIFVAIGMTDDERRFAESIEEYGTWSIQAVLRQSGHGQITDPARQSVMKRDDIETILTSVRNFADTFRANRSGQFTAGD